jgi:hypothetical protein
MVVAAIGILINGATAFLLMSGRKDDLNIRGAFLHMASDALVALGVVIAGATIILTGWVWLDPIVSILIGIVIVAGRGRFCGIRPTSRSMAYPSVSTAATSWTFWDGSRASRRFTICISGR